MAMTNQVAAGMTGAQSRTILNGNDNENYGRLNGLDANNIFKGATINAVLPPFLRDIKISGVEVADTDVVHVYWIWRAFNNSGTITHSLALGINGVRVASILLPNFVEPAAAADGARVSTLDLTAISGSGVTARAIVNWTAVSNGAINFFGSTPLYKSAEISPNVFRRTLVDVALKTQVDANTAKTVNLPADGNVTATNIKRGATGNVEKDLTRLDTNRLFAGSESDPVVQAFIVDISLSTLVVSPTDVVHIYQLYRDFANPTVRDWYVSIGINDVRVASWLTHSYVEPVADAKGNKFATLTLSSVAGDANNPAVTGTVVVNWAALPVGTNYIGYGANKPKVTLSQMVYRRTVPITLPTPPGIARIDNNNVFKGDLIETQLFNFLLDIKFDAIVAPTSTQSVHIYYVWRNITQAPGVQRWVVAIAIDNTRITQFLADNYTEPAAQANGDIIDTIRLTAIGASTLTATAIVNWNAITNGTQNNYTTAGDYPKGLISPNKYNQRLAGSANTSAKQDLPVCTAPNNVYTVLNDVDPQNAANVIPVRPDLVRNYSQLLYLDHFLKSFPLNTDVNFSVTNRDTLPVTSPRANDDDNGSYVHPTPSTIIAKSASISGGASYNDKTYNFNNVSTRESTGASALVCALFFGDSTIQGQSTEIGVPPGFATRSYGVVHEQFAKCRIDYLLSVPYSVADIQSFLNTGSSVVISAPDQAKFIYYSVGLSPADSLADIYTINYRGITYTYKVQAEGRGGWGFYTYINKPRACPRAQGSWDLIGLGDGTGADYTGSAAQMKLFDRTAWNPAGLKDTAAMRAYVTSNYGFTGTDTASYITWATQQGTFCDNNTIFNSRFYNAFYDPASTQTITDAAGDVWQVRFSVKKYLARYRTMTDAGVRLTSGFGARIPDQTTANAYDVFKPTHIVMQSCQNDGNVAHFGYTAKTLADAIRAEYSANSYGTVNIAISIVDGAGTYFPKRYPEVDPFCYVDEFQRAVHNDNLARIQALTTSETSTRIFTLCNTHISPTAEAIVYRAANSPAYELLGILRHTYKVASRATTGIKAHQNAVGHRCWGLHDYAWIKYTLGL